MAMSTRPANRSSNRPVAGQRGFQSGPAPALTASEDPLQAVQRATSNLLTLPFDALRYQYGAAVSLGLVERSMLAGRDFERSVRALEHLSLGVLARRV
jgi:hypothetical protein